MKILNVYKLGILEVFIKKNNRLNDFLKEIKTIYFTNLTENMTFSNIFIENIDKLCKLYFIASCISKLDFYCV